MSFLKKIIEGGGSELKIEVSVSEPLLLHFVFKLFHSTNLLSSNIL